MSNEVVPSSDLDADIAAYQQQGFRLDLIFPADGPRVAELSNGDRTVRLEVPGAEALAPSDAAMQVTRGGDWVAGRAGLQYRDLIPDRQGGRVIASHIRIAEPGPVPDYVHHHDIQFQMIFCRRGRVKVVYEDQGPPFWMKAGDCVLQPPHIRHRVLESADGCEVVEIASPAEHPTFVEHEITLPTDRMAPDRNFGGQRFSFDRATETAWKPSEFDGWSERATGIHEATNGQASVRVLRGEATVSAALATNEGELCLFFILRGAAKLVVNGIDQRLSIDDASTVKHGQGWSLTADGDGVEVLQVCYGNTRT